MSKPLTDEELAEMRERWRRATSGPWSLAETSNGQLRVNAVDGTCVIEDVHLYADMRAIVHAPTDVARLLHEVERLREHRAGAEDLANEVDSFLHGHGGSRGASAVVRALDEYRKRGDDWEPIQ